MRRAAPLLALLALLALASPAVAATGGAPRLRAVVTACRTGNDAASRSVSFTASMPARSDTVRMAIRFDLYQRTVDGGVWQRVAAPRLGRWERSRTAVAGFVYSKDVHGLAAPGEYRAVVRFRWWGRDGRTRTARKVTRTCKQPDPRPALTVDALTVDDTGDSSLVMYLARVRNTGRLAAQPFAVALAIDGVEAGRASSGTLAPRASATIAIPAPRCAAGSVLELRLDPDDVIDDATPDDGVVRRMCPIAPTSSG